MGYFSSIADAFTGQSSYYGRPEVPGTDVIGVPGELGGFGAGAYGPLRIPAKYYLEIRDGSNFNFLTSFPYDPQIVEINRTSPTEIVRTLSGTLRTFSKQKRHTIVIKGRSGRAVRTAYNRSGGIVYQDGETVFKEFDEFLKRYNETLSTVFNLTIDTAHRKSIPSAIAHYWTNNEKNTVLGPHMVLRCIDEDAHFKVEPVSFSYGRNSETNRFDYTYTLVLEAYDYAYNSKQYNPILAIGDIIDNTVGLGGGFLGAAASIVNNVSNDYVRGVGKAIENISTIVDASNSLANSVGTLGDSFHYIATSFCNSVDKFASAGDAWVNIKGHWDQDEVSQVRPLASAIEDEIEEAGREISSVLGTNDRELRVIEQYSYTVEGPENVGDELGLTLSQLQAEENLIKNYAKVLRGSIPKRFYNEYNKKLNETYISGKFLANEKNHEILSNIHTERFGLLEEASQEIQGRKIVLQRDDDLRKVALKYLGDTNAVYELIDANNWLDERRKSDGSFAQDGDTIIIPESLTATFNTFSNDGPIGKDISCSFDDLEFNSLNNDFRITTPTKTVEQILRSILLTSEGEMSLDTSFGIPQIVKTGFDVKLIGTLIRDSIVAHPYFVDVRNIETEVSDDSIVISCDVYTIDGDVIPVRTPGEL